MAYRSKALIPEQPLLLLPSLATAIGLNEAIVLQQLHYWLQNSSHAIDGKRWVYNSYGEWQRQFPFWSVETIKRIFHNLEEKKIVCSGNFNQSPMDRTKWYTIDYDKVPDFEIKLPPENDGVKSPDHEVKLTPPSGQVDSMSSGQNDPSSTRDYTETTNRDITAGYPGAEIRPISAPVFQNLNNSNSSEEPAKKENPAEIGPSSSEKDNPRDSETCPAEPAPDLTTTRKCFDFVSRAKNKPAALYTCLVRNFPEGNFPPTGEKRGCPLIGRVGLMAKKYSWARVLEEMGHARVDLDAGRIVAGDLLGWIEGRLKGGKNGGTGKNRRHSVEDAARRETGAFNQSCPYDPGDPNDPWSKFREVSGDADGPDA